MPLPDSVPHSIRISARELVYQTLVRWIITGTLAPGEKIPTEQVQEILGVSRTPIREALQLAEQDRLVAVTPGKESVVAQANPENWFHVVGPIAALEELVVTRAAGIISEKALADLEELNRQMREVFGSGDVATADELDTAFHQRILDVVGNPFLEDFLRRLNLHRRWYIHIYYPEARPTLESCDQHDAIIAALRDHDAEGAAKAMARNWERTQHVARLKAEAVDEGS